jgi:hypothetical protein
MAGSAVDAMLKHLGLIEGSVYSRIDEAVNQQILTPAMMRRRTRARTRLIALRPPSR